MEESCILMRKSDWCDTNYIGRIKWPPTTLQWPLDLIRVIMVSPGLNFLDGSQFSISEKKLLRKTFMEPVTVTTTLLAKDKCIPCKIFGAIASACPLE